ncbi:MAG: DUF1573 domain-containing protein [Bacteroidia bacterium]
MYRFLFLILLVIPNFTFAQLKVNQRVFNHGNIDRFNNDTAYFTFSNEGNKTIYLLPVQPQDDYSVLTSSKTLAPGESIQIGIVYYTSKKGRFEKTIPLYFSNLNSSFDISIKGNIKSILETAYTVCPSIENSKPLQASQIPLEVVVKDEMNDITLYDAQVEVTKNNFVYACVKGFASNKLKCRVDYGSLDVFASKKGYLSNEIKFEYNADNYTCIIYLKRQMDTLITPVIPAQPTLAEQKKEEEEIIEEKEQPTPVYIPVAYADSGFNSYKYRPNHLIFIIDISGSMQDSTKLYYLKRSIKEITAVIRPQDYITLISYTNKVKVVFENINGLNKSTIDAYIDSLEAGGGSNGSRSIVMAYELAKTHYIPNGNNQIFLATDGLLNSSKLSNQDMYKIASKGYRQHTIKLSSIGFAEMQKQ